MLVRPELNSRPPAWQSGAQPTEPSQFLRSSKQLWYLRRLLFTSSPPRYFFHPFNSILSPSNSRKRSKSSLTVTVIGENKFICGGKSQKRTWKGTDRETAQGPWPEFPKSNYRTLLLIRQMHLFAPTIRHCAMAPRRDATLDARAFFLQVSIKNSPIFNNLLLFTYGAGLHGWLPRSVLFFDRNTTVNQVMRSKRSTCCIFDGDDLII